MILSMEDLGLIAHPKLFFIINPGPSTTWGIYEDLIDYKIVTMNG